MKNCRTPFHVQVASKDSQDTLYKAATRKSHNPNAHQAQDAILTLIMSWAEAFNGGPLTQFGETYQKLLRQHIVFPARDMTSSAPVFTPKVNPAVQAKKVQSPPAAQSSLSLSSHTDSKQPTPYATITSDYISKLKSELLNVMEYLTVMHELVDSEVSGSALRKVTRDSSSRCTLSYPCSYPCC